MEAPFKRCGCGHVYPTRAEWDALEYAGQQITGDETGTYRTEMRHCSGPGCLSTLAIEERLGGPACETCRGPCQLEPEHQVQPPRAPTPEELAALERLWTERHLVPDDPIDFGDGSEK